MSLVLAIEIDGDGAHPAACRRAAHPPSELLSGTTLREHLGLRPRPAATQDGAEGSGGDRGRR